MVVDYAAAYKAVEIVIKNREGRNTVGSSAKCGAIASITTFGGAILLGPVGIFAGALAGSTLAYLGFRKKFKSIFEVIQEDFSDEERQKFIDNVLQFIRKFGVTDALMLLNMAQGNVNFQRDMFNLIEILFRQWQDSQNAQSHHVKFR